MRRALIIAGCVALALTASPALAKKKKKKPTALGPVVTVTATGPTAGPGSLESTAVATCPAGTIVVGGGFSAPFTVGATVVVHDSFRSSPTSWTAVGRAVNGAAGAATATALCRRVPKGAKFSIQTATQTASAPASFNSASPEAACPAGTKPIGGGFRTEVGTDASDIVIVLRNLATATGWRVTGTNGDSGAAHTVTAEAYCAGKVKGLNHPLGVQMPTVAPGATSTVQSPVCPGVKKTKSLKKGKKRKKPPVPRLSGGGWDFGDHVPGGPVPVAAQSLPVSGAWQVQLFDAVAFAGSRTISVQATCF